jgi:hypothetical protein
MKKTSILSLLFLTIVSLKAQEKPKVVTNTKLQYSVTVQGRTFPIFFRIDSLSATRLTLSWSYEDGRSGRFIATQPSIDSATFGYYNPPIDAEELVLPGKQHLLCVSKLVFSSLQKNGKAVFDGANVQLKSSVADKVFKLQEKFIDVLHLESESGAKIWILNNAVTPIIVKIENNPAGVDLELTAID